MSISGIRSNRGDGYQTLVAFDWALTVLSDPTFLWIEIDSISLLVDDVVIGKADGTLIGCQCKKNQPDFRAWSIADLSDELVKAARFLADNQNSEVLFYSRNNFGDIAKLREHCSAQPNAIYYQASLGKQLKEIEANLTALIATVEPRLSSYHLLSRTRFVTSDELGRMAELLKERLRNMVSNPDAAFDALWAGLDQLGGRMGINNASATKHRLSKDDLSAILHNAGAMLVPPLNLAEVRRGFAATSAIGRAWRRDIAGHWISSPVVNELLAAIDAKNRAILLTGLPGSGKTCVMLALQEALEQRAKADSNVVPLFIQAREFADLATEQDRHALGLAEQWVERCARLAESAHVVVVIDSLDVLSIARDHRVLGYFLAQIDRLLLVTNVTVVTACRDFDRHYDRRVAERRWDCELKCQPLSWNTEIAPLLERLGIATHDIDAATRELINNPRELALFVEMAQRYGSFNVVTSQALAQRYLDTIVRDDSALGDSAIRAIEEIALEMLNSRNLAVPYQRFDASQEVRRMLCSLNVLQDTHDGKLTFGHQTLLDVLVISAAMRAGVTLAEFIQNLSPVPFVRPSIRSFVAQLALGDRREFRRQIRTVLSGSAAFHIRRLVAESFSEQKPEDDDWPLLRELREKHIDVFQVIYGAKALEWHYFWLKHLVPSLRISRDVEGMTRHVYRASQWADADTAGVMALWTDALSTTWLDTEKIAEQLGFHLSRVTSDVVLIVPLLKRLLELPRPEHSSLGRAIARCVSAGVAEDRLLWSYIADGVNEENVLDFRLDNKLRCSPHEFGDSKEDFICQRMKESTVLLNLALDSIEQWSKARAARYGETRVGYRHGFLSETSYEDAHTQRDTRHVDDLDVLLDALEAAILHHAAENSEWWRENRERLCTNHEGALVYFAIRACTVSPEANLDLIGQMLCDKDLLEFDLSYELGALNQSVFTAFDATTQDSVTAAFLALWDEETADQSSASWALRRRAELVSTIPCCLRSPEAQGLLEAYEMKAGPLIRQPQIRSRGGFVRPPFSYQIFLDCSDGGVVRLLSHYAGYESHFDDLLIGGEREVGSQLREASSRHPTRFLNLLPNHWEEISSGFRDDIIDGVATYMAHRHGNLQINGAWEPAEEPDACILAELILDELERHEQHWRCRRSAAKALEACSNVINDVRNARRLILQATAFEGTREEDPIRGDNVDLISIGINMKRGDVAEALMILANNLLECGVELPEELITATRHFAADEHPAIRSLILRRLPYFQSKSFDFGWELFHLSMKDAERLWGTAERCLYFAYRTHFEVVGPLLERIRSEDGGEGLDTWGRISALAALDERVDFEKLLEDLTSLDRTQAWHGASTVWANFENIQQFREQCVIGLDAGLKSGHAEVVAEQFGRLFDEQSATLTLPTEMLQRCLDVFKRCKEDKHHRLFGFPKWLNGISQRHPEEALTATEIYLAYVSDCKAFLYDHDDSLTQLMTRLFAEAEEREESDGGEMLQRVVVAQDTLLSLGVNGVADWLKAAERP